jgi:hypothetical protein|tara:strand:+ start:262 stop:864 length:603 start_codon:yes stop_codon:yes gene_type:complete
MTLAFRASQHLDLPVASQNKHLRSYLRQEDRVIKALLDERQLERIGPGRYRYTVTTLQVFQLQVCPVVLLKIEQGDGRISMQATDATLEGLGLVDDFQLSLEALLEVGDQGLQGEAMLGVNVSQPPLLKLIPKRVLESTGESILSGILMTIKGRVGRQLVKDFQEWCLQSTAQQQANTELSSGSSEHLGEEGVTVHRRGS